MSPDEFEAFNRAIEKGFIEEAYEGMRREFVGKAKTEILMALIKTRAEREYSSAAMRFIGDGRQLWATVNVIENNAGYFLNLQKVEEVL